MKGLLLKEWYHFRLMFLVIAAAAVILPLTLTSRSFYVYYVLAMASALYPLVSASRDEKSRFDEYQRCLPYARHTRAGVYYLMTLVPAVILMISVCCIPQDIKFGFYRDVMTRKREFCVFVMPEGEFAFLTLMTKPQMVSTVLAAALAMPTVYLPVMLRFGQRAGGFAAFVCLVLYLMFLEFYRASAVVGSSLVLDELRYFAFALVTAAGFGISYLLSRRTVPE